jgi:hypothetical protein
MHAVHELLLNTAQMVMLIPAEDMAAVQREISRMHATMPIIDPTGYRALLRTMGGYERMVSALAKCYAELTAIVKEEQSK